MKPRTVSALVFAVLVVTGAIGAVAGVGASTGASESQFQSESQSQDEQEQEQDANASAYAGTHVAFEASSNALTNYRVGDAQLFDRVAVESRESHRANAGVGADVSLEAVTNLEGVGLSMAGQTETRATVETEGSASMQAHDTDRGILVVDAGGEGQYVEVALASGTTATASDEGDRVILERAGDGDGDGDESAENESESGSDSDSDGESNETDGDETDGDETENAENETDDEGTERADREPRTGAFIVVGDGTVTVTDEGNVTADLEGDSKLVFRSYADGERDEDAREQEDMIANGTATAEVYAEQRGEELVFDVATYGEDVAIEATEQSRERLELTVERAKHEGTVVIATVSDAALEAAERAEGLEVTVDGEAAVEASSYGELEGAIGSEESRYMVVQRGEAAASADVLVAVNHFSERTVAIESADGESDSESDSDSDGGDGDTEDSDDGDASGDELPGFGIPAALVALLIGFTARVRD